jgi:hypothetical protein
MNYSIFHIESLLLSLDESLRDTGYIQKGYNNLENQLNNENRKIFDAVVTKLLKYHLTCRDTLKVQKVVNGKFQSDLDVTALIIQFFSEIDKYVTAKTPEILVDRTKLDIANITLEDYKTLEEGVKFFSTFHNVLVYYLSIHKEILYLANHNLAIGCYGRYRVLLETYCIIKYFIKHQDCIFRFYDHQIIRDYLINEECGGKSTPENIALFEFTKQKYINEFENFKKPYGWAGKYINNYMTISEIRQIALSGAPELQDIEQSYSLLSEYSHVSSYAINSQKTLTPAHITQILVPSNELSLYILQVYVKFLLGKSNYKDKPIAYILPLLSVLHDNIFNKQK